MTKSLEHARRPRNDVSDMGDAMGGEEDGIIRIGSHGDDILEVSGLVGFGVLLLGEHEETLRSQRDDSRRNAFEKGDGPSGEQHSLGA